MFRAKISEAEDGYEVVIQWLFEPEKVESWKEIETSWVEAGVLARRPLTFLGAEDELARKFEVDFLPEAWGRQSIGSRSEIGYTLCGSGDGWWRG